MVGFVLGVIAGGVAAFCCRDAIDRYVQRQLPSIRERLADRLHIVEEGASDALGRARSNVSAKLRGGEQWLRAGTAPAGNGGAEATPHAP